MGERNKKSLKRKTYKDRSFNQEKEELKLMGKKKSSYAAEERGVTLLQVLGSKSLFNSSHLLIIIDTLDYLGYKQTEKRRNERRH